MKHCPNPDCRYRKRHGTDAEYQDGATTCSDCGTVLVEGVVSRPEELKKASTAAAPLGVRPWGRLGITVACCAVFLVASFTPLPGTEELQRNLHQGGFLALFNIVTSAPQLSLMAIGFTPILYAFILVELFALLVPGWRALRITGDEGRANLRRFTIPVAALIAVMQAVNLANYLRGLGAGPRGGFISYSLAVRPWVPWLAVIVFPLGTLLVALLAAAINRWGLGNGFSCLLLASSFPAFGSSAFNALMAVRGSSSSTGLLWLAATAVAACVLTSRALARKPPFSLEATPFALEIPPSGVDPLAVAASLLMVPATVGAFIGHSVDLHQLGSFGYSVSDLLLVASSGVALSLLYNQPRRVAQVWFGRGASESELGTIRKQLAGAALRGTALLLVVAGLVAVTPWLNVPTIDLLLLVVATAIALDLGKEWTFRRSHRNLVPAWPVHRVYAVQPALAALGAAGIPAFPRGLHHRTLLQFFGPYVPVTLLVPAEKAEEAERIVCARLVPDSMKEAPPQ